jgi:hypothetical protein
MKIYMFCLSIVLLFCTCESKRENSAIEIAVKADFRKGYPEITDTLVIKVYALDSSHYKAILKIKKSEMFQWEYILDAKQNILSSQKKAIIKEVPSVLHFSECLFSDLSNHFDFHVRFWRFQNLRNNDDSCSVKINIIDKERKVIVDSIAICSWDFWSTSFNACDYDLRAKNNYRTASYVTGKDTAELNVDNFHLDYGDIVVADLNFDGKEDVAVVRDWGKAQGFRYNFYIQVNKKRFKLDLFLTDSVKVFPREIDKKKKLLTNLVSVGPCGYAYVKCVYKFNGSRNVWKQIERKEINKCNY